MGILYRSCEGSRAGPNFWLLNMCLTSITALTDKIKILCQQKTTLFQ